LIAHSQKSLYRPEEHDKKSSLSRQEEKPDPIVFRKTLYVKPFWEQFESQRVLSKKREGEKWFQSGMNKRTTPL
jgi:hypothetical protein